MDFAVFHPGTQHSRQTALALQDLGRLAFLATSLFDRPGRRRLPGPLGRAFDREMQRYAFPALDPARVRTHGLEEFCERLANRLGYPALARRIDLWGNDRFGAWLARTAAREGPLALWGYNDCAERAFTDPRLEAMPKILDRTIADWRAWNVERERIAETHAAWLGPDNEEIAAGVIASNDREYAAATRIVCGSPFVARSIAEHSPVPGLAEKLVVLPYPFDRSLFRGTPQPQPGDPQAPVRFLFAGQVSARKGIQHLLEAMERIPARLARLTVAGPLMVPEHLLAPYRERVDFIGPVSRTDMPRLMRSHEAYVLPSHFEGSAITLLEALASGLAIIQSAQAGYGADQDSGIILAAPDADNLEQAMHALIADRERLVAMRRAALVQSQSYDFEQYRARIADLIAQMGL